MEPTTTTMLLTAASTAFSVVGAINQGRYAKAAAERDQIRAEENAKLAKLQAAQDEVIRREELRKTKAQQVAMAAALGFDPTQSRSFMALQKDTDRIGERDIANIRLRGLTQERRFMLEADSARIEGRAATTGARFAAIGHVLGGAGKILKTYNDANPRKKA